jgi:hypothetical protein
MQAYKQAEGAVLKKRKNNFKFTKGTDPNEKDMLRFIVDENIVCP